ncbi:MAG: hypothetical protein KDI30_01660 [Pseudomonadales bacterium]|nr:hypothetical protein [Pseudomonadales bacterium]
MKILYGVQGTGNGHLSRARAMAKHFAKHDVEISYLFSGRPKDKYFDMEAFGDFQVCKGMTFHTENGQVSYPKTLLKNNLFSFFNDVSSLDVAPFDLILNDFEPVSAWAGKLKGKTVINIGHQPAFHHDIPKQGGNIIANTVMRIFAPGHIQIGLHWHHFDQSIMPPILHVENNSTDTVDNKILVYLPFENQTDLVNRIAGFAAFDFYLYSPDNIFEDKDNLHFRPLSVDGFKQDLYSCSGVICNSGFELPSECIHLGKKLLVKPVKNQMEQSSNALALRILGLGETMDELDSDTIGAWLHSNKQNKRIRYPDVSEALVKWITKREFHTLDELKHELWEQVAVDSSLESCNAVSCSSSGL